MESESNDRPGQGATSKIELQGILWRMRADLERLIAAAGPTRMELPGVTDDWTFKDVIAHLTGWRWWSVARMEGAVKNEEPAHPWGADVDEDAPNVVDWINRQLYETNHDRPVFDVLRESRETFDRLEAALLALSDAELFDGQRYPWLGGYAAAAIVFGSSSHLYEEHEPGISAFLARSR